MEEAGGRGKVYTNHWGCTLKWLVEHTHDCQGSVNVTYRDGTDGGTNTGQWSHNCRQNRVS